MSPLTTRERIALRILAVMFKIVAPDQKHNFKNTEFINEIMKEDNQ